MFSLCIIWLCKKKWGRNQEENEVGKLSELLCLPCGSVLVLWIIQSIAFLLLQSWPWNYGATNGSYSALLENRHSVVYAGSVAKALTHDGAYKNQTSQGILFWGCWPMLDCFSFLLECNSLSYLCSLGIWVEFLGKEWVYLHWRIKVTSNTVCSVTTLSIVHIYWSLRYYIRSELHSYSSELLCKVGHMFLFSHLTEDRTEAEKWSDYPKLYPGTIRTRTHWDSKLCIPIINSVPFHILCRKQWHFRVL